MFLLVFCLAGVSLSQEGDPPQLIAWPLVHVGMEKQEALKKANSCCDVREIGIQGSTDTFGLVSPKDPNSEDTVINANRVSAIYFRRNKVVGIARDVSISAAPELYENGIALYRMLTSITRGEPTAAMIRTTTLDATNGTTRYIKLNFTSGRRVSIQVSSPDPGTGSKHTGSFVLSECEGTCADW
jgi:hypothetical protein